MTTTITKTVGSGRDYATLAAAATYANSVNFITSDVNLVFNVYDNQSLGLCHFDLSNIDSAHSCTIQPAPGYGVNTLDNTGQLDYSTVGVQITVNSGSDVRFGLGVILTGFRLNITSGYIPMGSPPYTNNVGAPCTLQYNRILMSGSDTRGLFTGDHLSPVVCTDNLIIKSAGTGPFYQNDGIGSVIERNTIVMRGTATGSAFKNTDNTTLFKDNVFVNCGGAPIDATSVFGTGKCANNLTDTTIGTAFTGLTAVTSPAFVVNSTNDYRPAVGSPLVGAGSGVSVSTLDLRGNNRGTVPDLGAVRQMLPATTVNLTGPTSGLVGFASVNFTASADGIITGTVVVTPNDTSGGGSFSPTTVSISAGSPTATFTYTAGSTGTKAINTTNNGSLSNSTTVNYVVGAPATALFLTGPTSGTAGTASSNFTVSAGGPLGSTVNVTPTASGGGTFNPTTLALVPGTTSGTFTYTALSSGNHSVNVTNDGGLTSPTSIVFNAAPGVFAIPTASSTGINVKSVGTGKDYATLAAFATFLNARDLVANAEMLIAEVYEDQTTNYLQLLPLKADATHYCIVRPVPGLGVNYRNTTGALDYGTIGIELTVDQRYQMKIGMGVSLQDFRIKIPNQGAQQYGALGVGYNNNGGTVCELIRNRILTQTTNSSITTGEYLAIASITDNLFIRDSGTGTSLFNGSACTIERNTFVRRGTGAGSAYENTAQNYACQVRDNVFVNCGDTPIVATSFFPVGSISNNLTDTALAAARTGLTANTSSAFVIDVAADYRPTTGSPMLGAGSSVSVSINDIRGNNRGVTPDLGALQLNPSVSLPTATVTSQAVDGQTLTISGTTTGTPSTGLISLNASATSNGAQSLGPLSVTIGSGTFSVTINSIVPGNYDAPVVTVTNSGGTSVAASGAVAVLVLGISGNPLVTGGSLTNNSPPTVAINSTSQNYQVLSASGVVNLQADAAGTLVGYLDPQPSGTSLGPYTISPSTVSSTGLAWAFTSAKLAVGDWKLRLVATANSQNVTLNSSTITIVPIPAPGLTVGSVTLAGQTGNVSGTLDFRSDNTGTIVVYADPQGGGSSLGPYTVTPTGTSWSYQSLSLAVGNWKLRFVATANSLSTTVLTSQFTVVSVPPTISISALTMDGTTGTINGVMDFKSDISGTVNIYLDPQPSGSSAGPFSVTATGGVWSYVYNNIAVGDWKLRVAATANGSTVSALTAQFSVIGASGNITLPSH